MSFCLYRHKDNTDSSCTFIRVCESNKLPSMLSLHFLKLNEQRGEQQRSSPLPWHLSEELAEITSALFDATGFTPDQIRDLTEPFDGLALVADIFPGDKKNVSLYQVKEI